MTQMPNHHPNGSIRSTSPFGAAGLGLMALWLLVVSAPAALVNVSNVSSNTNGGYAIVNESGSFLSDPPGEIFIGGFDSFTTTSAITTAFSTNFAALASDFDSIASVNIEEDSIAPGGFKGSTIRQPAGILPVSWAVSSPSGSRRQETTLRPVASTSFT